MSVTTSVIVYVMIWVVVLFLVLPWGIRIPEKVEPGHATSAPENPLIGLKLLITSIASLFLWIIAYLLLKAS
jgi:predicted secreted protein